MPVINERPSYFNGFQIAVITLEIRVKVTHA